MQEIEAREIEARADAGRAPGGWPWAGVIAFSAVTNLLALALPVFALQLFGRVAGVANLDSLLALGLGVVIALAGLFALHAIRRRLVQHLVLLAARRRAPATLDAALGSDAGGDRGATRALIGAMAAAGRLARHGEPVAIIDAAFAPLFVGVVFLLHPVMGWFALAGVLLHLAIFLVRAGARPAASDASGAATAESLLRAADAVRAMGMSTRIAERLGPALPAARETVLHAAAQAATLLALAMVLAAGGFLASYGIVGAGAVIAAVLATGFAVAPWEQAGRAWPWLAAARRLARRSGEAPAADTAERAAMGGRPKGHLRLEDVSFLPQGAGAPLIEGVTLEIEPGGALGIVGPSAAGKSMLARLMAGALTPTRGRVTLDDFDLAAWRAAAPGRDIGYLPQTPEFLPATIGQNIARLGVAPSEQTHEQVREAVALAGCVSLIASLPLGRDTLVGPGGHPLSAATLRRLALARAVFGAPALVVLDDPTANLDMAGERALIETLGALRARGTTVVLITHRPGILARMDRIVVLRGGRVETEGPAEAILSRLRRPFPMPPSGLRTAPRPLDIRPALRARAAG